MKFDFFSTDFRKILRCQIFNKLFSSGSWVVSYRRSWKDFGFFFKLSRLCPPLKWSSFKQSNKNSAWTLMMGVTFCPETSVTNRRPTLHNIQVHRRPQILSFLNCGHLFLSGWGCVGLASRSRGMRRGDANAHLRLVHWYTCLTPNLHHLKQKKRKEKKTDPVLSMGHVSRPTLYKYLNTKRHVYYSTDRGKYGNLMHQNYYRFPIQIISYTNTGIYLY